MLKICSDTYNINHSLRGITRGYKQNGVIFRIVLTQVLR